jgi:hypothetical protein
MTNYKTLQDKDVKESIPVLPLVFDSVGCKIPTSLAKNFMTCPLCNQDLKKVTTISICLHRFCESCIKKYLQTKYMNCPICWVRLSSLRQLRRDVEYGRLVHELDKVIMIAFLLLYKSLLNETQGLPIKRTRMESLRATKYYANVNNEDDTPKQSNSIE